LARAHDYRSRRDYVSEADRSLPTEEQTVYELKRLDLIDRASLLELDPAKTGAGQSLVEIVRLALTGWRNFKLPDGSEAAFARRSDGRPSDDTLRYLREQEASELFRDIVEHEKVGAAEGKP
jgi:hypothetical protein